MYGGKMSLDNKTKIKLEKAISRLRRTMLSLENSPVDPAVLDLIDLSMGMLERQLEMDIEFISEDTDDITNDDSDLLFLVDEAPEHHELAPMKPAEEVHYADAEDEYFDDGASSFYFLEENPDNDIPTPDELEEWYNLDSPE